MVAGRSHLGRSAPGYVTAVLSPYCISARGAAAAGGAGNYSTARATDYAVL